MLPLISFVSSLSAGPSSHSLAQEVRSDSAKEIPLISFSICSRKHLKHESFSFSFCITFAYRKSLKTYIHFFSWPTHTTKLKCMKFFRDNSLDNTLHLIWCLIFSLSKVYVQRKYSKWSSFCGIEIRRNFSFIFSLFLLHFIFICLILLF